MLVSYHHRFQREFPEDFPWHAVTQNALQRAAEAVCDQIRLDLGSQGRHLTGGLREALRQIAAVAHVESAAPPATCQQLRGDGKPMSVELCGRPATHRVHGGHFVPHYACTQHALGFAKATAKMPEQDRPIITPLKESKAS
jgi:hypothetical protein